MKKYRRNHPEYRIKENEKKLIFYKKNRNFVLDYKKDKRCYECGYNKHTEILQFHHKDETTKWHSIANSVTHLSRDNILKEIEKCILLCPNCHYWYHFSEQQKINFEKQKINKVRDLYKMNSLEITK
jgi:hypothetical protein